MKSVFDGIKNFFKATFLPPSRMNWGYPLFVMSLGVLTVYLIKNLLFHFEMPFSPTSIAFNALIIPLLTLIALGYRKIVVGPNPPACWTPAFIDVLRERYGVRLASDPETDLS